VDPHLVNQCLSPPHSLPQTAVQFLQDEGWKKVFIHQDLTLKEREERRRLLEQLKKWREDGEMGLVLLGNKVVKRFIKTD